MQQIKRSWFIAKLYKNAAVADPLANNTLLDYAFELIDNYVHVKWFDDEQVHQGAEDDDDTVMEHSDNEYVETKMKYQMAKKVNMEIVVMMII